MIQVEAQQIPHSISILGAIEPMNPRRARIGMLSGGFVELRFQRMDYVRACSRIGAGIPAGGISPARSFCRTFSKVSAGAEPTSARESPAV